MLGAVADGVIARRPAAGPRFAAGAQMDGIVLRRVGGIHDILADPLDVHQGRLVPARLVAADDDFAGKGGKTPDFAVVEDVLTPFQHADIGLVIVGVSGAQTVEGDVECAAAVVVRLPILGQA